MPERTALSLPCVSTGEKESSSSSSVLPRLISGSIGSLVTALAVTPLEVTKVRQQAGLVGAAPSSLPPRVTACPRGCGTFVLNNGLMDCVLPKSAVKYFDKRGQLTEDALRISQEVRPNNRPPGTFGAMRRIFLNEGIGGIYAGLRPTLYMSVPNTVMYYAAYDEIVARLRQRQLLLHQQGVAPTLSISNWWIPLVSGASARLMASVVTAPLELIRTRQAALVGASETAPGMMEEFRIIARTEGFGALYQGLAPTLWRDVPFSAIYWLSLEQFKLGWKRYDDDDNDVPAPSSPFQTAWRSFVNGATAGMIAAAATTPFDVVKTKRQTASTRVPAPLPHAAEQIACDHLGAVAYKPTNVKTPSPARRHAGTFVMMRDIIESEGVSGLWRGNQTRMIKVAPACAIMITCYEVGKQVMETQ